MNKVELKDLVGGALQEKFNKSFEKVIENLKDINTSFKTRRKITITLSFDQNEARDDVTCSIDVTEKLAPQQGMSTKFSIGKDLITGELFAEEYGKQIKGQMSINDFLPPSNVIVIDKETGEVLSDSSDNTDSTDNEDNTVVDFRNAAAL